MTRIAPQAHEPVIPEKRRAFKAIDIETQLFLQDGRCWDCGGPGPLEADHDLPRDLGGKTELSNLILRRGRCHDAKTYSRDRPMIDKARRIRKAEAGEQRKTQPIRSRGFQTNLTRGFDGRVRERS